MLSEFDMKEDDEGDLNRLHYKEKAMTQTIHELINANIDLHATAMKFQDDLKSAKDSHRGLVDFLTQERERYETRIENLEKELTEWKALSHASVCLNPLAMQASIPCS